MHASPPTPYTATQIAHLVGGPLCGADVMVPSHASQMTFGDDAHYGEGPHRISLEGVTYLYSAFLSTQRPTFRAETLPWDFGAPQKA